VVRDHGGGTWRGPGSPSTKQVLRGMWERTRKESNGGGETRRIPREERLKFPACWECDELQLRMESSEDEGKVTKADARNEANGSLLTMVE